MSERRILRRKLLIDCTNTPIPSPSLKPKANLRPSLSNSLTGIESNGSQQLLQKHNPSDDPLRFSTPQSNRSRISDDVNRIDVMISKTYTRSSTGRKKNKGKAVAVSNPSSCPPPGMVRSFGDKVNGEHNDLGLSKKLCYAKPGSINKYSLPQDFIDRQRAYFAEIDAYKLPLEVASESELE